MRAAYPLGPAVARSRLTYERKRGSSIRPSSLRRLPARPLKTLSLLLICVFTHAIKLRCGIRVLHSGAPAEALDVICQRQGLLPPFRRAQEPLKNVKAPNKAILPPRRKSGEKAGRYGLE